LCDSQNAPFTEGSKSGDAVRQNSVRAVDWDADGKMDLLAATLTVIWFFRNTGSALFPIRAARRCRPRAAHERGDSGGHARFDVCDWNKDGRNDLMVARRFRQRDRVPEFWSAAAGVSAGQPVLAGGKPIPRRLARPVLSCVRLNIDTARTAHRNDKDITSAENHGRTQSPSRRAEPICSAESAQPTSAPISVRLSTGRDGKPDLSAATSKIASDSSQHRVRKPGAEPEFSDPEGIVILRRIAQMISGADAIDWNGDAPSLPPARGTAAVGGGLRRPEPPLLRTITRLNTHDENPGWRPN